MNGTVWHNLPAYQPQGQRGHCSYSVADVSGVMETFCGTFAAQQPPFASDVASRTGRGTALPSSRRAHALRARHRRRAHSDLHAKDIGKGTIHADTVCCDVQWCAMYNRNALTEAKR